MNSVLKILNEKKEVDQIICLGDVAASGPQPKEALDLLSAMHIPIIMGNKDELLLNIGQENGSKVRNGEADKIGEIDRWCASQLTDKDREFIKTFKKVLEVPLSLENSNSGSMLCFHGSPRSNTDLITIKTTDDAVNSFLDGHRKLVMAGGHTHIQMLRPFGKSTIVNPGSVGQSIRRSPGSDSIHFLPWSECAILSCDEDGVPIGFEFLQVPLDLPAQLRVANESGMPHAEWWAARRES